MPNMTIGALWRQPAKGFLYDCAPVDEAAIKKKEIELGINFPAAFREMMLLQNGGGLRYPTFKRGNEYWSLFVNGGKINPLDRIGPATEVFRGYLGDEELTHICTSLAPCHPDRLIVFSGLDGHSLLTFDYGWRKGLQSDTPNVLLLTESNSGFLFEPTLEIENFDHFIAGLVYAGYECDSYYLGIQTSQSLDEIANHACAAWGMTLDRKLDDHYGWLDVDCYFSGVTPTRGNERYVVLVSPNQQRSGSYLFQCDPLLNIIIELRPRDGTALRTKEAGARNVNALVDSLSKVCGEPVSQVLYPDEDYTSEKEML